MKKVNWSRVVKLSGGFLLGMLIGKLIKDVVQNYILSDVLESMSYTEYNDCEYLDY